VNDYGFLEKGLKNSEKDLKRFRIFLWESPDQGV
jgi:hypothetical protein